MMRKEHRSKGIGRPPFPIAADTKYRPKKMLFRGTDYLKKDVSPPQTTLVEKYRATVKAFKSDNSELPVGPHNEYNRTLRSIDTQNQMNAKRSKDLTWPFTVTQQNQTRRPVGNTRIRVPDQFPALQSQTLPPAANNTMSSLYTMTGGDKKEPRKLFLARLPAKDEYTPKPLNFGARTLTSIPMERSASPTPLSRTPLGSLLTPKNVL
eukprot:TRINITY_DN93495_c0_g1_i1.p1 TRINITY_DN93495_c0_g1~~TRINITY_DN93495_c0_g1_i1.p1  ORF type:complete len:208 (-),score=18.93 TRINITY_DN93495_c0_g1_i1:170-793(-)